MTNLEYLAKLPKDDAWRVLDEYCPYNAPDGSCADGCPHFHDGGTCIAIALALGEFATWLVAERRGEAEG